MTTPSGLATKYGGTVADFSDLLHLAEPEFLVAPLIRSGTVHSLVAEADTGKSWLALDMTLGLTLRRMCLDQPSGLPKRVTYLDYEMGPKRLRKRLTTMGVDLHNGTPAGLHYRYNPSLPSLDTKNGGKALRAIVEVDQPDLLVIDTLSKAVLGDESSNTTYSRFWRYSLAPIVADGVAVLMLDHVGKKDKKSARGASAKRDNVDVAYSLRKAKGASKHDLEVVVDKDRDDDSEDASRVVTKLSRVSEPHLHHVTATRPGNVLEKFMTLAEQYLATHGELPSAGKLVTLRGKGSNRDAQAALGLLAEAV